MFLLSLFLNYINIIKVNKNFNLCHKSNSRDLRSWWSALTLQDTKLGGEEELEGAGV